MHIFPNIDRIWRGRRVTAPMVGGVLLPICLLSSPGLVQAQGPSIAAEQIWGTGRDLGPLAGAMVTLRPFSSGVALSGEWLIGTKANDLRFLTGSVGYSVRLFRQLGSEFYVRPALGVANIKRGSAGKTLLALRGDIEASRSLFGIGGLRGLLGIGGSLGVPLKTRNCDDCGVPSYDQGFSSFGVFLGVMLEIR